jgi:hypothetical protein
MKPSAGTEKKKIESRIAQIQQLPTQYSGEESMDASMRQAPEKA